MLLSGSVPLGRSSPHDDRPSPARVHIDQGVGARSDALLVARQPGVEHHDVCALHERAGTLPSTDACVVGGRRTWTRMTWSPASSAARSLPLSASDSTSNTVPSPRPRRLAVPHSSRADRSEAPGWAEDPVPTGSVDRCDGMPVVRSWARNTEKEVGEMETMERSTRHPGAGAARADPHEGIAARVRRSSPRDGLDVPVGVPRQGLRAGVLDRPRGGRGRRRR